MTVSADDRATALSQRVLDVRARVEESILQLNESISRLQATRQQVVSRQAERAMLPDRAYARLQARLASMPVIEQAKGIIMAQTGCGPDEAFDLLRKASQRGNIPVRELSAGLVRQAAEVRLAGDPGPGPAPARRRRR
jgi:ANTAR domain